MRIFNNCIEMAEETFREIWKRSQTIFDKSVQGRIVDVKDYEQRELIFYNFRVDKFDDLQDMLNKFRKILEKEHLELITAEAWLSDMINNPTLHELWWDLHKNTKEYYKKFCDLGNGDSIYSYGQRIIPQLKGVIKRLIQNKYARGAIISMNLPSDADNIGQRQPCTTSYHFICRPTLQGDKLNLIVNMRSADAINFFLLDFAKSVLFLKWMAKQTNLEVGSVIMSIDSLHVYRKDVPSIYTW